MIRPTIGNSTAQSAAFRSTAVFSDSKALGGKNNETEILTNRDKKRKQNDAEKMEKRNRKNGKNEAGKMEKSRQKKWKNQSLVNGNYGPQKIVFFWSYFSIFLSGWIFSIQMDFFHPQTENRLNRFFFKKSIFNQKKWKKYCFSIFWMLWDISSVNQ